jgi:hypothetical protein
MSKIVLGATAVSGESGQVCWAPVAAELPDGTPHPDPFLAERGWQVLRGVWRRILPDEAA